MKVCINSCFITTDLAEAVRRRIRALPYESLEIEAHFKQSSDFPGIHRFGRLAPPLFTGEILCQGGRFTFGVAVLYNKSVDTLGISSRVI